MPPVKKPKAKEMPPVKKPEATPAPVVSGQLEKKMKKQQKGRQEKNQRGVVFIRHLPHGFFEEQLRNYFEQFGSVTRLRLARSKTTGGSKGFAYVEFEYPEVAEVAAETMDNYLMFNKVVKAAYIPPEKLGINFFKTSVRKVKNKVGKPIYVSTKTAAIAKHIKKFNECSDKANRSRNAKVLSKVKKLNEKYAHLGIDFNEVLIGSKKSETTNYDDDEITSKGKGKRKAPNANKENKKKLKTTGEDSDDEKSESGDGDSNEINDGSSVDLEDLLGATINEDSDDHEWKMGRSDNESGDGETEEESKTETDDESMSDSSDEDQSEIKHIKELQPKLIVKKGKKPKEDYLEKLIKHKKQTGGIHKPTMKATAKNSKTSKATNAMQVKMAKQLAKPLPLIKKMGASPKKQKQKKSK